MTPLDDIKATLTNELNALNSVIRSRLHSGSTLMDTVINSYLVASGKQIRPVVTFLCAQYCGGVNDKIINAAAAIELLHNASLIHDDIVDESKMRRNRPTINALWDNHIAVLVGDFFMAAAVKSAIATDNMAVINVIGDLGRTLTIGEIDQIYNAQEHTLSEQSYFNVIKFKTASLFEACAKVACFANGADNDTSQRLAKVAEILGICFQIRDDVFDYFEPEKVGKPTGNDLREGKITLPLIYALNNASGVERDNMLALVRSKNLADDQIAQLTAFARSHSGIAYSYDLMHSLYQQCVDLLPDQVPLLPDTAPHPHSSATHPLLSLLDFIISRDY